MKTEDFNAVLEERIHKIKTVLQKKAGEYASNDDRMHNFKVAAKMNGTTAERALWGMMAKHMVSTFDLVRELDAAPCDFCPDGAMWDEKLGDWVNYLLLLEGLVAERILNNLDRKLQNDPAPQT